MISSKSLCLSLLASLFFQSAYGFQVFTPKYKDVAEDIHEIMRKGEAAFIESVRDEFANGNNSPTYVFVVLFRENAAKFREELAKNPNSPIRVQTINNESWNQVIVDLSPEEAQQAIHLYEEFVQKCPNAFAEMDNIAAAKIGISADRMKRNIQSNITVYIQKPANVGAFLLLGTGAIAASYALYRYLTKETPKKEQAKEATA